MSYTKSAQKLEQTYQFIKDFVSRNNYPPSVREICSVVGFKSTASAQYYLTKLEENGLIRKSDGKNRTIEIIDNDSTERDTRDYNKVPFLGNIAAGEPLLAAVEVDQSYTLPSDFFRYDDDSFLLKVKGSSMIDIGILDGDMVLINAQNTAKDGDIVVAQIDNEEVTLKRFFKEKDCIRLHPENSFMSDIIVEPNRQFRILGVISGLLRNQFR
ncbi:MAG: transcriptional repressor LexA [Christensenellales bacterium]